MNKSLAKGAFYFVVVILVMWTASLTYSFVSTALPATPWYVPFFSLIVFDAGMLAWMKVFLDYAEGSGQRAVALSTCVFDFIGVALMTVSEIFLGGQSIVAAPESLGEFALWGIGIWTAVNVGAVIAFHLLDPDARKKMALQSEKDEVFNDALKLLRQKRVENSHRLATGLSDGMYAQLEAEIGADHNQDGVPDIYQRNGVTAARPSLNGTPAKMAADGQPTPELHRVVDEGEGYKTEVAERPTPPRS